MSVYGWRWWDLSKQGSLQSVNGELWEPTDDPSEGLQALCFGMDPGEVSSAHCHIATLLDGRQLRVDRGKKIGTRANGTIVTQEGVPGLDCTCGFWAYYDPEQAFALPKAFGHSYLHRTKVFGVIEAWGGIAWMELGFRCEFAAVRAVIVQRGKLHQAYELPRYRNLETIIRDWDVIPAVDEE